MMTQRKHLDTRSDLVTGYIYIQQCVIEAIWKDVVFLVSFFFFEENRGGGGNIRRKHERVKVSTLGEKKSGGGRC